MMPAHGLITKITLERLETAVAIIVITLVAVHYLTKLLEKLSRRNPGSRFTLKWIEQAVRLVLWSFAILAIVTTLAPDSDTLFAALGTGAIAIGLGAQNLVKDLVGGFVLLTDRPYQLGDRVTFADTTGEVVHIGLRSTKLRTLDDTLVTIPNSELTSSKVENDNYGVPECMVVTRLYLPAGVDPDLAVRIGYESVWCSPYLRTSRPVRVGLLDRYTETPFMEMLIKAYVFDHSYVLLMQSDVTTRAKKQLAQAGVLDQWPC
jgi:small-conductance mechanosensitive channel